MKFLISPGHYPGAPGAINWNIDPPVIEHYICCKAAKIVVKKLKYGNIQARFFRGKLSQIIHYANEIWKPDFLIQLHLNSVGFPDAHGTEVIYSGISDSKSFAQIILEELLFEFQLKSRGLKLPYYYDNKGNIVGKNALIQQCRCKVYITEPLFLSNPDEVKLIFNNFTQRYAKAIVRAINQIRYISHSYEND